MLNVTPVVITFLSASVISFLVTAMCFLIALRKKIIALYLLGTFFLFYSFGGLFEGLADLFLNVPLRNIAGVSTTLTLLSFILFFNYVRTESFISIHLTTWGAISSVFLFLEFQPANHSIQLEGGYDSLARATLLNGVFSLLWAILIAFVVFWIILTLVKAPKDLKKPGALLLLSLPIIVIIIYVGIFYQFQPIAWGLIILNIELLWVLARWSQILYILPFKAYLLMVIETESGLPLYQYKWSEQEPIEEGLLSGLVSAIMSMGEDVLKRGRIKQIDWDLGMLIFTIGDSVTITLLSTKGSKALRASLLSFKDMFEEKFMNLLKSHDREYTEYAAADELIAKCFVNIPKYL